MKEQAVLTKTVFAIATVFVLAGCSGGDSTTKPASPTATPPAADASDNAVVTGKAPRGAVVTLESSTSQVFAPAAGPALMDQYGRAFVPDVLLVRVGQPVNFRNSEDTPHNVRVERSRTGALLFNDTRPPFETYTHTFDQPGQYDVICDIHPGMRATLVVSASPFAGVVGDTSTFTFADVPPGPYTLAVTMAGKSSSRNVHIVAPRTEIP